MSEAQLVRLDAEGEIGVITIDNPPVNALSPGVPEGIIAALRAAEANPTLRAIVLIGGGRSFIAGADIRQFGKNRPRLPLGARVYDVLDAGTKPVVAAIHGYALGGGLEVALACHYRIAVPSAKVGLPEVLIGILPGGGGTQRLPRLIGPKAAVDMIVTGRHVPAPEAHTLGILDEVLADGADLRAGAIAFAQRVAEARPLPRVRDKTDRLAEAAADPALFALHNAHDLAKRGLGPFFYLPKLQSMEEAVWWEDVMTYVEDALRLERGTFRVTVLIETLPAAFQMEEILYALRRRAVGLNCGRWDYIFSCIKKLRNNDFV
ncbi:MAG: enoyl-CoA hydratase-related protein, partial [Acetobacteraceae bacterium]